LFLKLNFASGQRLNKQFALI